MQNITALLLKNGIEGLMVKNENHFRQNINHALALKLNESFFEIKENVSKKLLYVEKQTANTPELKEFIEFVQNFIPGNYKFKNGSSINITESDMKLLTNLFESLNPHNRQMMVSEIFNDGSKFKQHLTFSQKVKQLL
jgi:hypothetical protein